MANIDHVNDGISDHAFSFLYPYRVSTIELLGRVESGRGACKVDRACLRRQHRNPLDRRSCTASIRIFFEIPSDDRPTISAVTCEGEALDRITAVANEHTIGVIWIDR